MQRFSIVILYIFFVFVMFVTEKQKKFFSENTAFAYHILWIKPAVAASIDLCSVYDNL